MKPTIVVGALALGLALLGAGCAGRAPNPVAVVQPTDETLSCSAIRAEVYHNNNELKRLADERKWKLAQNIGAGVGTILFLPAAFLFDFQGTQNTEIQALNDRQIRLAELAGNKCKP